MPLSHDDAAHLLRRVGFAGLDAEIEHFAGREVADVVDEILALTPTLPTRPAFARNRSVWPGIRDFRHWWIQRMIDANWVDRTAATPSPLVEKLTLFWHSHFATGASKVEDLRAVYDQQHILRDRGKGTFGGLLHAVCTDGAILSFLDNHLNTADSPQENFARELMELYTVGPSGFTERDVVEMTRAWTGHGTIGWEGSNWNQTYRYYPDRHDNGSKTLFGQTANWNGPETLSLFTTGVRAPACARFLARKLWRFFVNDSPTDAQIARLAAALGPTMNISALLRTMLTDPAFWDSRYATVRSPIEFVVDVLRRTGVRSEDSGIEWQMDGMGQGLFAPPSVAGWDVNGHWVNTKVAWGKARFVNGLRWNEDYHSRFDDILDEPTAAAAVDRMLAYFGLGWASPETRAALAQLWRSHGRRHQWAAKHNIIIAATMSPEFQVA
jgi:uncharacterized protein (DUF1800 family)